MKLVRQRIVDRFNLRVGEQFFIRAISFRDTQSAGDFLSLVEVA